MKRRQFRSKEPNARFMICLIVFYCLLFAAWALIFGKLFGDALSAGHLQG